MSDRPVALVIGTYDPDFPRNRQMVRLLESHGWDVRTLPIPLWGSSRVDEASGSRVVVGLRLVLAMLRVVLAAVTAPRPDLMITLHPGQFDAAVVAPIARLRGIPLVTDHFISLHETVVADRGLASEGSAAGRLLRWFDRRAIRTAALVVADTPEDAAHFAADAAVDPERFVVAWVGADPALYAPTEAEPELDLVLFYGTYISLHGCETIVEAAATLRGRGIRVRMLGDGQERAEIEALARRLGDPVEFVPPVPEEELRDHIGAAAVCLGVFSTGPKASRVVPNKVFQCLSVGRPVVTGATPAVERALGDAVVTVPPGDPAALAEAVASLVHDDDERRRLAAAGRAAMAGPFSEAAIGARLDGALRSLVGGSGAGAPAPAAPPLTTMAWLRHDQILDQVAARRPASVLEVGAGQGAMGWRLAGQADYVGLEPDERSSAVAAERLRGRGEIRTGGLECLGGAERFDMVCAFEVLEHIDDDVGALRAWRERLHPGGSLLISVPAHRARFGRSDEAVGHFRRYDRSDLAETIAAAGFDDIDIRPYGAVLGPALERVRNGVLAVRPPSDDTGGTSGSGRLLQPDHRVTASAMRGVAAPFRRLQRTRVGHRGVGWVAVATRRSD